MQPCASVSHQRIRSTGRPNQFQRRLSSIRRSLVLDAVGENIEIRSRALTQFAEHHCISANSLAATENPATDLSADNENPWTGTSQPDRRIEFIDSPGLADAAITGESVIATCSGRQTKLVREFGVRLTFVQNIKMNTSHTPR